MACFIHEGGTWVGATAGDGAHRRVRDLLRHVTFLKENGIYILETMNTGPLVAQSVKEFMFVLGQARIKGAVQMIINPVALW